MKTLCYENYEGRKSKIKIFYCENIRKTNAIQEKDIFNSI